MVANVGLPISATVEFYGFGNYSMKDQTSGFFYRRPGVSQLLPLRLADGSIYDPRAALYPAGFTPQFGGEVTDTAVVGGLRGERDSGFTFDLSVGYGNDRIDYRIANTLNPSLGPDSPTRFRPGSPIRSARLPALIRSTSKSRRPRWTPIRATISPGYNAGFPVSKLPVRSARLATR